MDRIVVEKIKPQLQTKSGLFLPEGAKGPSNTAKVLAVGPGRVLRTGETLPCSVKIGDTVVIPEYGGMPLKLDEDEFHIYRDEDVIGVLMQNEVKGSS